MNADHKTTPLKRRGFLRLVAIFTGTGLVSTLLEACARVGLIPTESLGANRNSPAPTSTLQVSPTDPPATLEVPPTEVPAAPLEAGSGLAPIALIKTQDRVSGMHRAFDLLELDTWAGKRVFVKPNFNSADPSPGSTHPELLRALVQKLWALGAASITVGDRSGMGHTRTVMERLGIFAMAEELGFEVLMLDQLAAKDWQMIQPDGGHWQRGFPFARAALEADVIVQTCCLKTHRFGGHFTLSLKNSVGLVAKRIPGEPRDYMTELHNASAMRSMIAEVNAAYQPDLVILDGVEAFVDGGPEQGTRVAAEVILAGTDRVALDAVGVAVLRHFGTTAAVSQGPIFQQEQIAGAVELGLGVGRPEDIRLLTDDPESEAYAQQLEAQLLAEA